MATLTVVMAVMSWDVLQVPPQPHVHVFIFLCIYWDLYYSLSTKKAKVNNINVCISVSAPNSSVTLAPVPTQAPTPPPTSGRCSPGQFLCRQPPHCIPSWQRCDGQPHCQDGSDEAQCRESLHDAHLYNITLIDRRTIAQNVVLQ